jgi:DNA-binding MurR/RpiR family transcriptional regulator
MTGPASMDVAARIAERRGELSATERRVAAVVLAQPELVAFGTVVRVAEQADASGASVVRLATRLGYQGFAELQAAVQADIGQQLRPAAERIRNAAAHRSPDLVAQSLHAELDNVDQTLRAVSPDGFEQATMLLSAPDRPVRVLAGDAVAGVGAQLVTNLSALRPDVAAVAGSDVTVARQLAPVQAEGDLVLVTIDLRRYERWVVEHTRRCVDHGADAVVITDSLLSPLASSATVTFTVRAEGVGPFDSQVGTLALVNALVTGVAGRLRPTATPRLAAVEQAWSAASALLEP